MHQLNASTCALQGAPALPTSDRVRRARAVALVRMRYFVRSIVIAAAAIGDVPVKAMSRER